jgi:rhizosphere induced protein
MQDLSPGAIFRSMENLPADTSSNNAVTLSNARQNMRFIDQRAGSQTDNFYIHNAADVPMRAVAEGLAQNDRPVFVVAAQPNMQAQFGIDSEIWIAFGEFEQGEVLDPGLSGRALLEKSKVIYGPPTRVVFPSGVTAMDATLNADNSWTILPTR